jgi:nucleotide-binding universal stress UspA family protein
MTSVATRSRRTEPKERAPDRPILVATAGEEESRGALRVAAALAAMDGAPVVALGVAGPFPHNLSARVSLRPPTSIDEQTRRDLHERIRDSLSEIRGSESWVVRAFTGTPADLVHAAAAKWKARIIVLGTGRHSRLDRIFGSETAVAVMRNARIPVLAVHKDATGLPVRAVAAVDFTDASLSAATVAAHLLATDGTLFVAHACAFGQAKAKPGDLIDLYRAGAQAKLDETVSLLRTRTKRRAEGVMLTGEAGSAIVAFARRERCDLIALGGHPLALVDRILLGSVRTRVVRDASCSVLIAPPDLADASAQLGSA